MKKSFTSFRVKGVVLDGITDEPSVLLEDLSGYTTISLDIGPFEARAIIVEMEHIRPHAPLAHDLLSEFLTRHRFKMLSFTLDGYEGAGMVGKIHYRRFFKTMHIPARPSDGIALAVRMKAPIYLSDDILSSYFFIPGKEKQHLNEYRDVLYL
jgi:hypothetical protein